VRLEITDDCCARAREWIADGYDPDELLEFMRGDVVSLCGTARAFASRMVKTNNCGTPVHVPYKARGGRVTAPPIAQNLDPLPD